MNARAKALITSAVVVALALAAVSGVTYSWFSDSEESTINVTTGKLDLEIEKKGMELYANGIKGSFLSGSATATVEDGSITVTMDNMAPGDKVVLSITIKDTSTISHKIRYSLMADDYNGLFKGLNISAEYDDVTLTTPGYSDWKDTVSTTGKITVEHPISAGNEYQSKSVVLKFGIEAYQSNADIITSGNSLTIQNLDDLKYFAYSVNNGKNYLNETVALATDIDLKNELWTPIGPNSDTSNKFRGTFDGQGHTISNLKIDTETDKKYQATGFFGALNGNVKNLVFDGAEVRGFSEGNAEGNTSNGIAVVAGSIYNSGTISNVEVKNATVTGNRYVGTISGYVYGSIEGCTVENVSLIATPDNLTGNYDNGGKIGGIAGYWCSENEYILSGNKIFKLNITAYRDAGGIVGVADAGKVNGKDNPDIKIINNSVNTVNITIDQSKSYGNKEPNAGGICGRLLSCSGQITDSNKVDAFTRTIGPIQNQTSFEFMAGYSIDGDILILATDDCTLVNGLTGKTLTLKAAENTEVGFKMNSSIALHGSSLTFENLKFIYGNTDLVGIQHTADMVYAGCTIEGKITLYGNTEKFKNCKFVNDTSDYNVWTYGGQDVKFSGCNFSCAGKSVLVYNVGSVQDARISFDGCTFNSTNAIGKSAVEIDTRFSSFNVSIDNCTLNNNWSKGTVSGTELWNNKAGNALKISINGTEVAIKKVGFIYGETDTSSITYLEVSKMSTVLNNDSIEAIVFGDSSTWNLSAFKDNEDYKDVIFEISDGVTPTLKNTPQGWIYRFYGEGYTGYGKLYLPTQYASGYFDVNSAEGLIRINEDYSDIDGKLQAFMVTEQPHRTYLNQWNVKLTDDLNFNNNEMTSIPFKYKSLDGQGHTIKNVNIVDNTVESKKYVGLFKTTHMISNLKIYHIRVSSSVNAAMIGTVAGYTDSEWNNVHVYDFKVESTGTGAYTGGLLGDSYGSKTNCSVSDGEVIGGKRVGGFAGLIGAENATTTLEKCTVNSVKITASEDISTIGSFAGRINSIKSTITLTDCTANVTGDNVPSGKIYGDIPNGSIVIDSESKP